MLEDVIEHFEDPAPRPAITAAVSTPASTFTRSA